ncbi:hypothetical protein niasHS_017048 [Heterodera schachtii]|uniref:Uncharacterized protein n=1 Tax=Heterodera schachtii TaxID=97005 RepID=A0ABD2ICM8_HETSC
MPFFAVLNQQKGAPNANEIAGRGSAKGENSVRVNRSVQSNGDERMEMVAMAEIRYEQKQQVAGGGLCCCCIPCCFFNESSHEEPPKIFKFFMSKKKTPQQPPAEVVQPQNSIPSTNQLPPVSVHQLRSVPSPKALPVENYTLNATFTKEEAREYAKMTFKKSKKRAAQTKQPKLVSSSSQLSETSESEFGDRSTVSAFTAASIRTPQSMASRVGPSKSKHEMNSPSPSNPT